LRSITRVPRHPFRRSEQDQRRRFFGEAARYTGYVAVEAEGLTFLVSTADEAPGGKFFRTRSRQEFPVLARACDRVDPRGVFVDVGANVGTTTLAALNRFDRAIAVEAEPRNAALLRANAALNGLEDRVSVVEAACSSTAGEVELRLSHGHHGGHAVGRPKAGEESLHVPAITLDELVANARIAPADVGLVWMDVGGHEEEVLRGGASLLEARVPIVAEVRPKTAPGIEQLLAGRYVRVVDLRTETELRLEELAAYLDGLGGDGGRKFTDVLLT
jgi:FkbM family methyltransferase